MIYVVRHGQTKGNVARVLRGRAFDDKLTKLGFEQAKETGAKLKDVKFDICYCSPMTRTRQTYQQISKCPIIFDERILPMKYDDSLIGKSNDVGRVNGDNWKRVNTKLSESSESVLELETRVFEFLDEICARHKNENVLVVTHASVCKPVKGYFWGIPESNTYADVFTKNGEIIKGEKKKI